MKNKDLNTSTLSLNVILRELLMKYIRNAMEISSKTRTYPSTLDSFQTRSNLKLVNSKKNATNCQLEAKSRTSSPRP